MADSQILAAGTASTPLAYTVPNAQEIVPKAARAQYDGTGAAGAYIPTLQIVSDGGVIVAECPMPSQVTAGGSVDSSWFPGINETPVSTNVASVGAMVFRPNGNPQSIPSGPAGARVAFTNVQFDTSGMFNAGAPSRLTCTVAGTYIVTASGGFVTNGAGDRGVGINKNGVYATSIAISETLPPTTFFSALYCSVVVSLVIGDFLELTVYQSSGGNLNTGDCQLSLIAVGNQAS